MGRGGIYPALFWVLGLKKYFWTSLNSIQYARQRFKVILSPVGIYRKFCNIFILRNTCFDWLQCVAFCKFKFCSISYEILNQTFEIGYLLKLQLEHTIHFAHVSVLRASGVNKNFAHFKIGIGSKKLSSGGKSPFKMVVKTNPLVIEAFLIVSILIC